MNDRSATVAARVQAALKFRRIFSANAELLLQHLGDGRAHEIDDFLLRIDDAHRVGQLDRVALEEPLVNGALGSTACRTNRPSVRAACSMAT